MSVKVEYKLTDEGRRLQPDVEVMKQFGLWVKSRQAAWLLEKTECKRKN